VRELKELQAQDPRNKKKQKRSNDTSTHDEEVNDESNKKGKNIRPSKKSKN